MTKNRESFVFFKGMQRAIQKAPVEKRLELYEALFDFALDGIESDDFMAMMLIEAFKPSMEKARSRYNQAVENGKKGGRPKKEPETCRGGNLPPVMPRNNEIAGQARNDNDGCSDNDGCNEKGGRDGISSKPPTIDEIKAFCKQRNNKIDPQRFYDYFSAANWIDNKGNKVINWKQKVIAWEALPQIEVRSQRPEVRGKTRFNNYEGRKRDYSLLQKANDAYLMGYIAKGG